MEYLMTYSWAILVVMIVGIAMWQLGIFSMGGITPTTSTGFNKIKPLLALAKMGTDGSFDASFINGAGTTITVGGVTLNNTAVPGCYSATPDSPGLPKVIASGDNIRIQLNADAACAQSKGAVYTMEIIISYNQTAAGATITRSDSGTLRGPYEEV